MRLPDGGFRGSHNWQPLSPDSTSTITCPSAEGFSDGSFRDDDAIGNPYTSINERNYMTAICDIFFGGGRSRPRQRCARKPYTQFNGHNYTPSSYRFCWRVSSAMRQTMTFMHKNRARPMFVFAILPQLFTWWKKDDGRCKTAKIIAVNLLPLIARAARQHNF